MNYITNPIFSHQYSAYRLSPLRTPDKLVTPVQGTHLSHDNAEQIADVTAPTSTPVSESPSLQPAVIIDLQPSISSNNGVQIAEQQTSSAAETNQQTNETDGAVNQGTSNKAVNPEASSGNTNESQFAKRGINGQPLSKSELVLISKLRSRDETVRAHEAAHVAAGSGLTSMPSYSYQVGPDGKRYAVGGSVTIDTSPANTPEETIAKAEKIQRAALAPVNPSSQDRIVATKAKQMMTKARMEMAEERKIEIQKAADENKSGSITNTKENIDNQVTTASSSKLSPTPTSDASRTNVKQPNLAGNSSTILNSDVTRLSPKDFPLLASQSATKE